MGAILFLLYGFGFAGAFWVAASGRGNSLVLLPVFLFGGLVSLSRVDLATGDLPVYVEGFLDDEWSFYYLREAPFWALGRALTALTGEPRITFAAIDLTLAFLLARTTSERMGWQAVVLLITFPTVLGFTNIYRQLFAAVLMMIALRRLADGERGGAWIAAAACTIHIAMLGLCLSLLAAQWLRPKRRQWLVLAVPAGVAALAWLASTDLTLFDISGGTESRGGTGPLYVAVGLVVHALCAPTLWSQPRTRALHQGLLLFFVAGALSLSVVPDSTGTRLMMISMHLTAFLLLAISARQPRNALHLLALALLLVGPVLISDSAWHLIFGYEIAS